MNEIDLIIKILDGAIKAGESMLPKQPRRWLAKHGGEIVYSAHVYSTPIKKQRAKSLAAMYLTMVGEAKSLIKPVTYTE